MMNSEEASSLYTSQKINNKYIVSVKNHTEIVRALTVFCETQHVKAGTITGIGAISKATLRFFNPVTKHYVDKTFSEQMEIANVSGNISEMNNQVYLHLHATLGRSDYSALAGHLMAAELNGAGEFVIEVFDATIERYFDEAIGLNLYQF